MENLHLPAGGQRPDNHPALGEHASTPLPKPGWELHGPDLALMGIPVWPRPSVALPLLPVRSAGQQVAVPLACVERVERLEAAGADRHPQAGTGDRLQPLSLAGLLAGRAAAAPERTLLHLRDATGGTALIVAEGAGPPLEAPAIPLPAWLSEHLQPFSGVALVPSTPLPVLAPERLGRLERRAQHLLGAASGAMLRCAAPATGSGGALLVCPAGPYRLRGRPLAIGLPLASCVAVQSSPAVLPAPPGAAPCTGLLVYEREVVPICSVAALLGLPETERLAPPFKSSGEPSLKDLHNLPGIERPAPPVKSERLVIVRLPGAGLLGLPVAGALTTMAVRHVADPALLRPLPLEVLAGAIPTPRWWIAVIDPARLERRLVRSPESHAHPAA